VKKPGTKGDNLIPLCYWILMLFSGQLLDLSLLKKSRCPKLGLLTRFYFSAPRENWVLIFFRNVADDESQISLKFDGEGPRGCGENPQVQ
jgi:hypothetical protein